MKYIEKIELATKIINSIQIELLRQVVIAAKTEPTARHIKKTDNVVISKIISTVAIIHQIIKVILSSSV
jgi:hypothetical protein